MKITKKRRIRINKSKEEVHNNWAISYGDMITLLLGFFVLYFNVNSDSNHLKLLKKDLDKKFSQEKKSSQVSTESENITTKKLSLPRIGFKSHDLKVTTNLQGDKLLIEFPNVLFFNKGEFNLTEEGLKALESFAKVVNDKTRYTRLIIRGYTDSTPVVAKEYSRYKDNLELSALRSISAIRALSKSGVQLSSMRIAGYGETDIGENSAVNEVNAYDRKIAIVIEPLDQTERGYSLKVSNKEKRKTASLEANTKNQASSHWSFLKPIFLQFKNKTKQIFNKDEREEEQ